MKAQFVFEKFTEESDPIKDMDIGYSERMMNSMSFKILKFIENKGKEGAGLTEIQYYIWTELEGHDPQEFWFSYHNYTNDYKRKTRGHWTTNLYGTPSAGHIGLLHKFCEKNQNGKWVLKRFPNPKEKFYR